MKFIRDIIGEKRQAETSISAMPMATGSAREAHKPDLPSEEPDAVAVCRNDVADKGLKSGAAIQTSAQSQDETDADPGMSEEVAKFFASSDESNFFLDEYDEAFDDYEDVEEDTFDQPGVAATDADAHSGQAAAPAHIPDAELTPDVQEEEMEPASPMQATSDHIDQLLEEDLDTTDMIGAHDDLGRQESYSAEATTSTAQFTEEPELAEMRPAAPCPSVAMRGRPLHHSAPPEPTEDAGPIPQHAAQPRAAVEVPQPAVGRGASRHGRVKTRLLGFNTAMETDADPMLENDKAGAAPYTSFPVGWLIVVDGPGRGSAFTLFQGVSTIGRGEDQTVRLDFGDNSISRAGHASIAYDIRQKGFFIGHGGKANIVRRNDRPVLSTEELAAGDTIMIGETSLRFVPLCCQDFSWDQETEMGRAYANRG
ncbi:hypothetical protein FIU86_04770 [Roseovarius sp. THAF9]|uniref:FHA domain-containing protein n=1 Tax=Roseovarius sp. THAF9 TaxID=2587847 RepID=UPI0012A87F1D|nr:FHA domain-containing protein [Roseovarius sp. THAF9]QFT92144.1 hypothetical protein FIU86_04770 [Roseovarius sp. THAF9]